MKLCFISLLSQNSRVYDSFVFSIDVFKLFDYILTTIKPIGIFI